MEMKAWLAIAARAACFALATSAVFAEPVAILTDVQGRAVIETADASKPLGTLAELREGARVRLDPGARAAALYLTSGAHYDLAGPGQVEFPAAGPAASGGATVTRRPAPPGKEIRLRATGLAQGGVIVRSGGLRPVAPAFTVLEEAPEFVWYDLRYGVRYRFTLVEDGGPVVFETDTDARKLHLPASLMLRRGAQYRWRVTPASGEARGGEIVFRVADDELMRQVNALRPAGDAAFPDSVAYALWLEDMALWNEAIRVWRELAAARPADPALRSRAARGN
jgi:hypothetical protein